MERREPRMPCSKTIIPLESLGEICHPAITDPEWEEAQQHEVLEPPVHQQQSKKQQAPQ
jgi:hypothetical protein